MTVEDVNRYFQHLDDALSGFSPTQLRHKVAEDFPNYHHIGSYCDPLDPQERDQVRKIASNQLKGFSFDPLLSFNMVQPKYATEILHPDCSCFRRLKRKERPIKSCSHRDRLLYACWNFYLSGLHKSWLVKRRLENSISAYVPRTGKSNAHYAKLAFDYVQGRASYSAVAIDIKGFFDQIPHGPLYSNLIELTGKDGKLEPVDFRLYKATTTYNYVERDKVDLALRLDTAPGMLMTRFKKNWQKLRDSNLLRKNEGKGIPQGLACSGVLANIVMMQFDRKIADLTSSYGSLYIRYADDIFLAAPDKSTLQHLYDQVAHELEIMQLPLADKKTEWFHLLKDDTIHPKISYLGLTCQGTAVSVRMNGVNKFYERTRRFIFSYVLTCRKRGKKPSLKRIRAIFGHTGRRNYYAYLRRASKVFEQDSRYQAKGIKGVMRKQTGWLEDRFEEASIAPLTTESHSMVDCRMCTCPLQKDG